MLQEARGLRCVTPGSGMHANGVPGEMTSALILLSSACPFPWPSWISGDMMSPFANSE